jgi:hypothetical protein
MLEPVALLAPVVAIPQVVARTQEPVLSPRHWLVAAQPAEGYLPLRMED